MDDGFWEGELDGRVGVFPSLVVELMTEDREEEEEEEEEEVEEVSFLCHFATRYVATVDYVEHYGDIVYPIYWKHIPN